MIFRRKGKLKCNLNVGGILCANDSLEVGSVENERHQMRFEAEEQLCPVAFARNAGNGAKHDNSSIF